MALPLRAGRHSVATRVGATCLALLALFAAAPAAAEYEEYELKAAFLLNFARLVEWPAAARPEPGEPLVVGVHGEQRAVDEITEALAGKVVNDRPLSVRALEGPGRIAGCHIAFVATGDSDRAAAWAEAAREHATLTVGEAEDFAHRGGIVNFFVEDNKLRFEINREAADRSDLTISSRLLRLARLVESPP